MYVFALSAAVMFTCYSCASVKSNGNSDVEELVVAFYNVENLFDTIDDGATLDEDFTPGGKLQWNSFLR